MKTRIGTKTVFFCRFYITKKPNVKKPKVKIAEENWQNSKKLDCNLRPKINRPNITNELKQKKSNRDRKKTKFWAFTRATLTLANSFSLFVHNKYYFKQVSMGHL